MSAIANISNPCKATRLLLAVILGGLSCGELVAEDNTSLIFNDGSSTNLGPILIIGDTGTNNTMLISNGSTVFATTGIVGNATAANFNSVTVTDPGSIWSNAARDFYMGNTGSFNRLVITNGGRVVNNFGDTGRTHIGGESNADFNVVIVTGTDSEWAIRGDFRVGKGVSNELVIADGGKVNVTRGGAIGDQFDGLFTTIGYNRVLVTGPGSEWNIGTTLPSLLTVGRISPNNQLIISNGGLVTVSEVRVGDISTGTSTNLILVTGAGSLLDVANAINMRRRTQTMVIENDGTVRVGTNFNLGIASDRNAHLLRIDGGHLVVTNSAGTAVFQNHRGTNLFNSGTMTVDNMIFTNNSFVSPVAIATFIFNGGTLNTRGTIISNGSTTVVGDGLSVATLNLDGGSHSFANDLLINTNATLMGTGTVTEGDTTVLGTLAPGAGPGTIHLGNLRLASNATFAVELNGTTVGTEYDQADVTGFANISNSLLSISLGFAPTNGDTFLILNNDGSDAVLGEFAGLANHSEFLLGGGEFKILYDGGTGNDILLIAVPEPGTALLCVVAFAAMFRRRT